MPYIDKKRRDAIWCESRTDYDNSLQSAGELNYFITCILQDYLKKHGKSYQTMNDISGAMTECLAEFRRRVIVPYEIKKAKINGDVYK